MKKILIILSILLTYACGQCQFVKSNYNRDGALENPFDPVRYEEIPQFKPCFKESIISSLAFQGYENETQPFQGFGEVSYYYRFSAPCSYQVQPDGVRQPLRKPIIIIDGFDPGDSRSGAKIYGKNLSYKIGATDTYLGDIVRGGANDNTGQYDVVILNFPRYESTATRTIRNPRNTIQIPVPLREVDGGADYIERNALVLIQLIQNINAELKAPGGSNEKITIIGPSMGGQISRYALAFMEQQFQATGNPVWDHNCRLWFSFDSPHLGANVPIGDQWFLKTLDFQAAPREALYDKLGSPAARQQLLHHWTSGSEAVAPSPYRTQYVQNLTNNGVTININGTNVQTGFPNPSKNPAGVRKVAIVNGNLKSIPQQGTACGKAMRLNVDKRILARGLAVLLGGFWIPAGTLAADKRALRLDVYFAPQANSTCTVLDGEVLYPLGIPINLKTRRATALDGGVSIDLAPGGTSDTQAELQRQGTGKTTFINTYFTEVVPNHAFMNTKSALAYNWNVPGYQLENLGENLSTRLLVCENSIPFDTYLAAETNEEHTELTEVTANFALNEIRGIPQKPVAPAPVITTPSAGINCINQILTFSVPAVNYGTNPVYNWFFPAFNFEAVGSTNSPTIQLRVKQTGVVNVSVFVESACVKTQIASSNIRLSCDFSGSLVGLSTFPCGSSSTYTAEVTGGNGSYSYLIERRVYDSNNNPGPYIPVSTTATYVFTPIGNECVKRYNLRLTVTSGNAQFQVVKEIFVTPGGSGNRIAIYPNPSEKEVTAELTDSEEAVVTQPVSFKLINHFGQVVRSGQSKDGKVRFNTEALPEGSYFLHIDNGTGEIVRKQVLVRK